MLDLNTASAQSLEELPGVGPSTAAAIVRTRESRGPFLTVQELLEVPGIGETKLSQIEPFVRVGG
jgi:competence protein ComEA